MGTTIKAVRAEIFLGEISLSVYRIPNGEYKLAGRNVTEAVGEHDSTLPRFYGVKSVKALPHADSERRKVNPGKEGSPFDPVAVEDAVAYWGDRSLKGNAKAAAILVACAIEAIERRADAAFGKQRSEEERQYRLKARIEGKVIRRTFTDAVKDYLFRHPDLPESRVNFMYSNSSDKVNQAVFGRIARTLCRDFQCDKNSLRDCFNETELRHIAQVEEEAMILIDEQDIDPCQAVLTARSCFSFRISDRIADPC